MINYTINLLLIVRYKFGYTAPNMPQGVKEKDLLNLVDLLRCRTLIVFCNFLPEQSVWCT